MSFFPGWQKLDGQGFRSKFTEWLVDVDPAESDAVKAHKIELRHKIIKVARKQWLQLLDLDNGAAMKAVAYIHPGLFLSNVLGVTEYGVVPPDNN